MGGLELAIYCCINDARAKVVAENTFMICVCSDNARMAM